MASSFLISQPRQSLACKNTVRAVATCCFVVMVVASRFVSRSVQSRSAALRTRAHFATSADVVTSTAARTGLISSEVASDAYIRQREAADKLVAAMRAAPGDWERGCFHRSTGALWIDPFRDFYRCPYTVEKVGSLADGGKWVCGVDALLQRPGCVVYSFGSNGDTSFERAILNRTACSVWTFDPTLSEAAAARVAAVPGINFTAVGLAATDGAQSIQGINRPGLSLSTIMEQRGHAWVDVLKVDIEGAEWQVLDAFTRKTHPLPVTQALIELHVEKPDEAVDTMSALLDLGMQSFHVEENNYCSTCPCKLYEVALMHVDGTRGGVPCVGP